MKTIIYTLIVFISFYSNLFSQEKNLILVHPTEYNIKLFTYLVDNNLVQIDDLKILGIYHKNEVYNYSQSLRYLESNNLNIELKEISNDINASQLFEKNNCTSIYSELFKNSKGILFLGGPDLPPAIYGEQMSLQTSMTDPYRHYFEASFLFHLLGSSQNPEFIPLLENNPDYVVYAICLGMQTMNIATGGTITQDIPNEIYNINFIENVLVSDRNSQHRNYNNNLFADSTLFSGHFHEIKIHNSEPIVGAYKEKLMPLVYSNHHQAIKNLGKDLKVIATSMDGKIIEAITHKKYSNVLGIQFHPEGTYLYNSEIKNRKVISDSLISGKQILIDHHSYDFHLEFWKTFSNKMNSLK